MICVHCGESFRLTKFSRDKNVCPDCSGEVDDFSIPDEELTIVLNSVRNPNGRTKAHIELDQLEELD